MFNKIGDGRAQADERISVCFGLNISRRCLYLSPPHQYRQNLRKSWISPGLAEPRVQSGLNILDLNLSAKWVQYVAAGGVGCWALAIHFSPFVSGAAGDGVCRRKQKLAAEELKTVLASISCQWRMQMLAKDCRDLQIWGISLLLTETKYLARHCRLSLWQYDWYSWEIQLTAKKYQTARSK